MANAQNTSDLLQAEQQLTIRQSEIESIQGRLQYLEQSAALSFISVTLSPNIITQPVDVRWKPLETVKLAIERLGRTMTDVVDFLINLVIVVVPTLLAIGLVIGLVVAPFYFAGRALWRRRKQRE